MGATSSRSAADRAWELITELQWAHGRPRSLAVAAELELTTPQLLALRRLDPDEPMPMSALAQFLRCDNSNVTGIVDRLEDRGLVERRVAAHDRRIKMLELTERGASLREQVARRLEEAPEPLRRLSAAEQRQLRDLLRKALGQD